MRLRRAATATLVAAVATAAPDASAAPLVSSAARAAPRITIGPVKGDAKAVVPAQLAQALCGTFECVLWREVSTRRAPDLRKAAARGVRGILVGAVARGASGRDVELSLLTGGAAPARRWTFPLPGGRLSDGDLRRLEAELTAVLSPRMLPAPSVRRAPPAPASTPAPGAVAPRAAEPPGRPEPEAPPSSPARADGRVVREREPVPEAPPEPMHERAPQREHERESAPGTPPRVLAVEVGAFLVRRTLDYGDVGPMSGSLHGLDARGVAGPWIGAELLPAAPSRSALRGLGLSGRWRSAIGFTVEAPSGEARDARFTAFEAGAAWRTAPFGAARLVVAPSVAWRGLALAVTPPIPGLPDARLSGVRGGLALEARLGRVVMLGRAGWTRWLQAKELVEGSPAFFPGGSAQALDAEAGVGVALGGRCSLRVVGEYELTRYALDPDPTGTYAARRADDRYLGGRLIGRLEL